MSNFKEFSFPLRYKLYSSGLIILMLLGIFFSQSTFETNSREFIFNLVLGISLMLLGGFFLSYKVVYNIKSLTVSFLCLKKVYKFELIEEINYERPFSFSLKLTNGKRCTYLLPDCFISEIKKIKIELLKSKPQSKSVES